MMGLSFMTSFSYLAIAFGVKSLINGLSFDLFTAKSISSMLGRWSDMSVIKFPAETFVCIRFFGVFSNK